MLTRFLPRAAMFALLAALIYSGALDPLERLLSDWRFKIASRPASGTLTVVEIDSASLRKLDTWPWPRGYYATAIQNLRDAGAKNIGIDIDVSAKSDPAEDAKLAAVIAASKGRVILPVFMQPARGLSGERSFVEIAPSDRLRDGALLATVNLMPEGDGVLRKGYFSLSTPWGLRPSMAATVADAASTRTDAFYIDFGIDLPSVTRLSFSDVLAGHFDKRLVAGRNVLMGATALELGDEFAVPVHGIASGVFLHALSYESIVQGRTLMRPSLLLTLLIAAGVIAILGQRREQWSWLSVMAPHAAIFALAFGAPLAIQIASPVSLDASPILAAQLLCLMRTVGAELERRARVIFLQRAANARQQALVTLAVKDSSDGIIVTDALGRIELCNERAATLFGVCPIKAVGQLLADLAPDFPIYPRERLPGQLALVPSDCFPVFHEHRVGEQVFEISSDWTLCEDQQAKDVQGGYIYVHTLRDVSARKRIEEAERKAKEALIAASHAKSQFIQSMSHELRTPLNAVIGFSEMMGRETAGPLNETYAEYIKLIHQGGRHLLSVVNNVLEVTRLESGDVAPDKEPVALAGLIEAVVESNEARILESKAQLTFDVPSDMQLIVDRKLIGQTLQHLLSNALKFTLAGGRVSINARAYGDEALIEVRDNGIGVAQDELPKLAQAFYQADPSLSRAHDGTGLGLFLVTKYLALHGARLELESTPGDGFLARIRMPGAILAKSEQPLRAVA